MKEANNNSGTNEHHPTIIKTETKEIRECKPPNDKIVYFNLMETDKKERDL